MYQIGNVLKIIKNYYESNLEIQNLQNNLKEFSSGDQKIGVFAEFYSFLYLKRIYPYATTINHVESGKDIEGWDIYITFPDGSDKYVQVKSVSQFNKNRIISKINGGFDDLYLISLTNEFIPNGFWINKSSIFSKYPIRNKKIIQPDDEINSKQVLDFSTNLIDDLIEAINSYTF